MNAWARSFPTFCEGMPRPRLEYFVCLDYISPPPPRGSQPWTLTTVVRRRTSHFCSTAGWLTIKEWEDSLFLKSIKPAKLHRHDRQRKTSELNFADSSWIWSIWSRGSSLNSFGFPSLELCKAHQYQYRSQHPAAAAIDVARQRERTLQTGRIFDKSTSFIFFTRTGALAVPALKSQTGPQSGNDDLGPEWD